MSDSNSAGILRVINNAFKISTHAPSPFYTMSTPEPIDLSENSTSFDDNTIVIEIDNLLIGWPTYTIHFEPECPGPVVSICITSELLN
jgi:hypothetical protein